MKTDDKLERFIRNNPQDFDNLDAPPNLFSKIDKELSKHKKTKVISLTVNQLMKIVSAIFIPILISYIIIGQINQRKISKLTAEIENSQNEKNPLVNELMESENYYNNLIEQKTNEIYATLSNDPELIKEIDEMLNEIDNSYRIINADFNENVNSESVVTAMVSCQRLKLQSLEEIQKQVIQSISH